MLRGRETIGGGRPPRLVAGTLLSHYAERGDGNDRNRDDPDSH
jgi:hypothetical protein